MPADAPVVAPAPPAVAPPPPAAVASEGPEPERAAVQPAASPADAEHLGNRIAALASRIHAATYELLSLIREFDAAGAWSGFGSCAVWLSWRTGLAPVAAREHVRVAHALAQLPKVSDAMRRGRVSYSKVRAITRVATPETEQSLLDVALAGTAAHVERMVRAWRQTDRAADGGIRVGQETARRIACDAATVTMRHGPDGGVLDVGRRTRTVSPALRRALAARDGQCRFPGCEARRCDAHHIRHWADGGETALANLVLLCRRHHRAVHEEGFRVRVGGDGTIAFLRPDGRPLAEAPAAPDWDGAALAPVDRRLADAGVGIDAETAPRWQGERLDVGWAIDVLWRPRAGAPPRPAFPRKRPDRDRRRKP